MISMEAFYVRSGPLLITIQGWRGDAPRRTFYVRFEYEFGWAEYDGREWQRHIYTPAEQERIDKERAAA